MTSLLHLRAHLCIAILSLLSLLADSLRSPNATKQSFEPEFFVNINTVDGVAELVDQKMLISTVAQHERNAYVFKDVCITMNGQSADEVRASVTTPTITTICQEQRGILWFDPHYNHPKRCVPCSNPVMSWAWDGVINGEELGHPEKNFTGDYVTDMYDIDSGRWKKEGGLLSDGGHRCGMMWAHKMVAKSVGDYNECNSRNQNELQDRGQQQRPLKGGVKRVVYHSEPTLLLQYKKGG
jgi:hypothetical protein